MSGQIRFNVIVLIALVSLGSWVPKSAFGQYSDLERRVKRQQAEVRSRIEDGRQKIEYQRNQMTANRNKTIHVGKSGRIGHVDAATEYVFHRNDCVAYFIQVEYQQALGKAQWMGVILLTTKTATPLRADGSAYDYAKLDTRGMLAAYQLNSEGKLKRNRSEDIPFPDKLNFQPMGAADHKIPKGKRNRWPGNMNLAIGVIDAIFPKVPLFEGTTQNDISREYWVQTEMNPGRGSLSLVQGKGTYMRSAQGNQFESRERIQTQNKAGTPLFEYDLHQVATFDTPNRRMASSTTSFVNLQDGSTDSVVVTARLIDVEQARKIVDSMN